MFVFIRGLLQTPVIDLSFGVIVIIFLKNDHKKGRINGEKVPINIYNWQHKDLISHENILVFGRLFNRVCVHIRMHTLWNIECKPESIPMVIFETKQNKLLILFSFHLHYSFFSASII